MLSQLKDLSLKADGRYATEKELDFLKFYLQTVRQRISGYEKIRDGEDLIMDEAEAQLLDIEPQVFHQGARDFTDTCRRDRKNTLRYAATAMLFNDLDRLRDGLLLWQRTIVRAIKGEHSSTLTWQEMPEILRGHLSAEEADLMMPALHLNQALLR